MLTNRKRLAGSRTAGSGRSSTVSTSVKITRQAAIPNASNPTTPRLNRGLLPSVRAANRRSFVDIHIYRAVCRTAPPRIMGGNTRTMLTVLDTNAMPWEDRPNEIIGRTLYRKNLFEDPDTGMEVRLVRYPAGVINPLHTHPCAHGMYVLEGTLVTHQGSYGPGTFVWFPEGSVMEHGAAPEQDVVVLFITNKPFEIHYK